MSITILPYSHFCPVNAFDEQAKYFITILDEVNIELNHQLTVFSSDPPYLNPNNTSLNKIYFNINNNVNNNVNNNIFSKSKEQTIIVPKGTRYVISDKEIDKICLVHRFEINQELVIQSNTKIKILKNTNLTLLNNQTINFILNNTSEFYVN